MNSIMVWLRSDRVNSFPREVGLNRRMVHGNSFLRYVDYCKKNKLDCYVAVFSEEQISKNLYDTILFDVDGGLEDAHYVKRCLVMKGYIPKSYYTGRGWHFYTDFEPVTIEDYGDRCREFAKEVGIFELVDKKCLGDKRRMARVPGTINTKTSELMVEEKGFYCDVSKLGEYLLSLDVKTYRNGVCNINNKVEKNETLLYKTVQHSINTFNNIEHPLCVLSLVEKLAKTKYLKHEERLFLGSYLVNVMDVGEALKIFSCVSDFSSTSEYQLSWLFNSKYSVYKCKRLKEMGLCVGECEFYPWIGKRFK